MACFVLDSGAVLALARGDSRTRAILTGAEDEEIEVFIPAVVVAETVRGDGPRDAAVNRVLKTAGKVVPTTEDLARTAGALLAAVGGNATIDALVVAEAIARRDATIVTGDPGDMRPLAERHPEVVIQPLS